MTLHRANTRPTLATRRPSPPSASSRMTPAPSRWEGPTMPSCSGWSRLRPCQSHNSSHNRSQPSPRAIPSNSAFASPCRSTAACQVLSGHARLRYQQRQKMSPRHSSSPVPLKTTQLPRLRPSTSQQSRDRRCRGTSTRSPLRSRACELTLHGCGCEGNDIGSVWCFVRSTVPVPGHSDA